MHIEFYNKVQEAIDAYTGTGTLTKDVSSISIERSRGTVRFVFGKEDIDGYVFNCSIDFMGTGHFVITKGVHRIVAENPAIYKTFLDKERFRGDNQYAFLFFVNDMKEGLLKEIQVYEKLFGRPNYKGLPYGKPVKSHNLW